LGALIDTTIFIEYERRRLDIRRLARDLGIAECFVSVVNASELLHGLHRATDERVKARRAAFIDDVLQSIAILPVDLAIARTHSRLWADLEARGRMIGPHDAWLAASGVTYDLALVTANIREFGRVPGLTVMEWSEGRLITHPAPHPPRVEG